MKFHVRTYGCQMNERDSEAVEALLAGSGFEAADTEGEARLVIVNTCSVRGKAEDKALGKLGLLAAGKRERPDRIVGAMGCMVQRMKQAIFARVPGLDFAVGTHNLHQLPDIVRSVEKGRKRLLAADETDARPDALCRHRPGVSGYVNILLGCNRGCAYCVVPSVRGREYSRPADSVLREVREMVSQGCREIVLLGQSVMAYGRANPVWPEGGVSPRGFTEPLPRLLEAVDGVEGVRRIRFTSGHPSGITPELVRALAELPAVCEHLHLPLQSGSDRILGLMRRGYTADDYRRAVGRLRGSIPDLALTTDLIVGFPSETLEDFDRTLAFVDEIGFDNSFVFKYSPRPGTPASEMADDVPAEEKMRRNQALLALQDTLGKARNRAWVGREVEVLAEGVSLRKASRWSGRSRANTIVVFEPRGGIAAGDVVTVRIERASAQTLYGSVEGA